MDTTNPVRKNSGFTLVEMIIAMLISGILISAIIAQSGALERFNKMTFFDANDVETETPVAVREARLAMRQMTYYLRFANPDSIVWEDKRYTWGVVRLFANIEGGHISSVQNTGIIVLGCRADSRPTTAPGYSTYKVFYMKQPYPPFDYIDLSNSITFFNMIWDSATRLLTLQLRVDDGTTIVPLETTIRVLGNNT